MRTVLPLAADAFSVTERGSATGIGRRRALSLAGAGLGALLAGCADFSPGGGDSGETNDSTPTTTAVPEATVTVRLRNRDDAEREYEVVVRQGGDATNRFSGVLPPNRERWVETVATFRPTDERHEVIIDVAGSQRGSTWDPSDCDDYLVEAMVESGDPEMRAQCRTE